MSDKKLTIFQRLGQVIGPDSAKLKNVYNQPQRFNIGKELLKTTDKKEYELAKLQAQQNKYLGQMWKKVENGLYQQSINYETTRIGSYADFEAMEFYPIIAAALDIIMEEATTINDKGKVLNVYSESNRVKTILQDLFFNRLDIHTSLPMWTRNTPIRENSVIPLLDGTEITIKELSNRVKNGEDVWSYAIQDITKAIVPSKIVWCDLTRRNSELYRVTLDDGTYIDTTPDHEYMLRDGSFKRADELTEGQSLMPFYTKTSVEKYGKLNGYEKIYNPSSDKYEYTHRIIDKYLRSDKRKKCLSEEMSGVYPKFFEGKTKTKVINHKVISVSKLNETADVYCLEAVGPNGEHDRHNFPVCGFDSNNSYSRTSGVFLSNCKYGDNFLFLNVNDKHGITGAKQMPNYEMERRESGLFDMISGSHSVNNNVPNSDKVKFYWRGRDVEFNSWQMAHFRLLGDDRRLPYGTSILEKARRIWKQCVHEDTLIWTDFGYKKIKDLTINDIIYSYDFNNKELVKTKINDVWETGQKETFLLKTRYNNIKLTDNHPVLIFDGNDYSYKTLNDIKIGKDFIVTPINKNGVDKLKIKLPDDNFYIKLNETGVKKMSLLNRSGIMVKLKEISSTDYKNIHRFIQNGGKIKYKYLTELNEKIGLTIDDIDVFYSNTITSMVNKNLEFEADSNFFNFFGFMLGDGWLIKNTGIGFALGIYDDSNKKYIDYVKNAFKDKIIITQSKHSEYSKSVIINSGELNQIMKAFGFITGFSKKVLPEWVFTLDLNGKREIINGLFEADGSDKYGVIGLANKNLIVGLKELCNQAGVASGKITTYPSKVKFNKLTNKTEVRQESYKLYINFNNIVDDVRHEKVISYESIGVETVWDLTTENELHNFIGDGIVVHNCILAEDSMLVYRVTRAPERRVYKIYVGNIDDADVPAYVNEIADRFKRTPIIDSQTGQMDLRFNQLSNDQDFFIPVRSEDAPNPIDTLPGASNLSDIADIEYLRNNLFTALRIPKPFLGFDETSGEGKNLALQDIRFSRTVNRVQQSMLQELNKIAIIHLYLLGFEDDLDNFSLTLNNPSTQAEMLKIEHLQQKITLLKDAVSDIGNGFGTMSWTRAHREILGWSNDEIKKDLLEQRMEKAASGEIANTANVIKHTGMFDDVDKIYGDYEAALKGGGEAAASTESAAPSFGGGGGGGGIGGGLGDLGGETTTPEGGETPELGGELGGTTPEAPAGGETSTPEETLTESLTLITENKKLLTDKLATRTNKYKNRFVNLIESIDGLDINKNIDTTKITDKNIKVNDDINQIINEIDKMLDE